jgi:hypothetical protein
MIELAWHLMFRTDDDRVIAPGDAERRILARTVYRITDEAGLLAFGAADNHLHVVVVCTRERAGRLAQQLAVALRGQLGIPVSFFPTRIKEVRDQHHLQTVFHYALGQRNRHGVRSDPFLDASSLPELLGARLLRTGSPALARELLPRVSRPSLVRHLAIPALEPGSDLVQPVDAVAGALGLGSLDEHRELGMLGRAAVVQLCSPRLSSSELVELLGRTQPTIRRLRHTDVPPRLLHAAQLQMAIRAYYLQHHPGVLEPLEGTPLLDDPSRSLRKAG